MVDPPRPIPNIIHQIWIGDPARAPRAWMATWQEHWPDVEVIQWDERELHRRGVRLECHRQIACMPEINGKADIIRWEILYQFGGVFVDADSVCLGRAPFFDGSFPAFACYENENLRAGLVSTGVMGFPPRHPLCRAVLDWILSDAAVTVLRDYRAWYSVGPARLTEVWRGGAFPDVVILPSHWFLPVHFTGETYHGHRAVYAHQMWCTAKRAYGTTYEVALPRSLTVPTTWVSVLIPSYNTPEGYLKACLDSILDQVGWFGMEIVWVNDGSDVEHTATLTRLLAECGGRFCTWVYVERSENGGVAAALNDGLARCSHEWVVRMDSDDIMRPTRIMQQLAYVENAPATVVCGAAIQHFWHDPDGRKVMGPVVRFPSWPTPSWPTGATYIMNHPTLMYRKQAVLDLGGYDVSKEGHEDFDLEMRLLTRHGRLDNLPQVLVDYRIHAGQSSREAGKRERFDGKP